jgi:formylglycine-generating enzyme required for sulfatase activity
MKAPTYIYSLPACILVACSGDVENTAMTDAASCAPLRGAAMVTIKDANGEARRLSVDRTEVTNADFARFVDETGYITRAERGLPEEAFSNLPDEARLPGSAVFTPPEKPGPMNFSRWWRFVEGADWRRPEGPQSSIDSLDHHPVVHIAYEDAVAYADWAGRRLPTAAEWEAAATPGAPPVHPDGDEANIWTGIFPITNTREDGYAATAPAGCYPPNANGLYDVVGNVWEWTSTPSYGEPGAKKLKGGSYLCARNYCARYRTDSEQAQDPTLGASHIGFRTVADIDAKG